MKLESLTDLESFNSIIKIFKMVLKSIYSIGLYRVYIQLSKIVFWKTFLITVYSYIEGVHVHIYM